MGSGNYPATGEFIGKIEKKESEKNSFKFQNLGFWGLIR
jgi:hypothetical protein